jgi:hypothetical protein
VPDIDGSVEGSDDHPSDLFDAIGLSAEDIQMRRGHTHRFWQHPGLLSENKRRRLPRRRFPPSLAAPALTVSEEGVGIMLDS